jgi:hypothetical protein
MGQAPLPPFLAIDGTADGLPHARFDGYALCLEPNGDIMTVHVATNRDRGVRPKKQTDIANGKQNSARSLQLQDCLEARGSCCAPVGISVAMLRVIDAAGELIEWPFGLLVSLWGKGRS